MPFCKKCGAQLDEGAKFCGACGAKQSDDAGASSAAASAASTIEETLKNISNTEDNTTDFDSQDINDNKVMAVLSYFSWLVLIPLIASKSRYARFHVNQGLVLTIVSTLWNIVYGVVKTILYALFGFLHLGFIASIIVALLGLVNLVFLVLSIMGVVNAATGKAKKLPVIGGFTIIK